MDYRRVPWKRNFLKLPAALQADLEAVASDLIAIAATKKVPLADIEEGLYLHLGLRIVDGAVVTGDPVHPPGGRRQVVRAQCLRLGPKANGPSEDNEGLCH